MVDKEEVQLDEVVAKWNKRYSKSLEFHQPIWKKFSKYYDQMYASVNADGMADWRSKVFIPVLNEKAWQMVSKVVQGKAGWDVLPKDETWLENAKKQQSLLKYQFTNPEFDRSMFIKEAETTLDAVVTGTGVAKVFWTLKEKKIYERIMNPDGTIDFDKYKEITTKLGYNEFEPVNIYDFLPAPGAKSVQTMPWGIIKGKTNVSDALEMFKDYPEAIEKLKKFKGNGKKDDTQEYKGSRTNYFETFNIVDTTIDEFELWECFDRKKREITYILDGREHLRTKKDISWHGKLPIVVFNLKPKGGSIFGEGLFEVSYRLQYAINDLFNHYMDSYNLSVDGMVMLDEASEIEDFITEPGGVFHFQGNPPIPWNTKEPNPTTFTMVQNVLREALDGVTLSPYATGQPNDRNDKTQGTATGVIRLQEAAGDLIGFMRQMLKTGHKEVGYMWMMNNQQYVDREQKIIIEDGIKKLPELIKPVDLVGEFELDIDVSVLEPVNKEAMRQVYLDYMQQLKDLVVLSAKTQTPWTFNIPEAARVMSDKFGIQEYDKILNAEMPVVPQQEEQDPNAPTPDGVMPRGMTPEAMLEMITGKPMNPDVHPVAEEAEAMVEQMGNQPQAEFKNDVTEEQTGNPEKKGGFLNRLLSYTRR